MSSGFRMAAASAMSSIVFCSSSSSPGASVLSLLLCVAGLGYLTPRRGFAIGSLAANWFVLGRFLGGSTSSGFALLLVSRSSHIMAACGLGETEKVFDGSEAFIWVNVAPMRGGALIKEEGVLSSGMKPPDDRLLPLRSAALYSRCDDMRESESPGGC